MFTYTQVKFFLVFLHLSSLILNVSGAKYVIPQCSHKPSSNSTLIQTGSLVITANVLPTEEFLITHFSQYLEQPGGMGNLPYITAIGNSHRLLYRWGSSRSLRLHDERLYWRVSNISRYDALLFNWAVLNRDNGVDINFESERFIIPGTPPGGAEYRQSPGSGCSSGEAGPSTQLDSPEDAPSFIPAGRGERCAVPGYTLRMGTSGYGHYRTRAFQVPAIPDLRHPCRLRP